MFNRNRFQIFCKSFHVVKSTLPAQNSYEYDPLTKLEVLIANNKFKLHYSSNQGVDKSVVGTKSSSLTFST